MCAAVCLLTIHDQSQAYTTGWEREPTAGPASIVMRSQSIVPLHWTEDNKSKCRQGGAGRVTLLGGGKGEGGGGGAGL